MGYFKNNGVKVYNGGFFGIVIEPAVINELPKEHPCHKCYFRYGSGDKQFCISGNPKACIRSKCNFKGGISQND
jgi:hypothetical protein